MKGAHTFSYKGSMLLAIHHLESSYHYTRTGVEKNRFILQHQHHHPLAGANGSIAAARYILYAKTGNPRWAACSICGYALMWKNPDFRRAIYASFADSDPTNLEEDNVIALCCWCNTGRAWGRVYPEEWARMVEEFALVSPFERPNPLTLLKKAGCRDPRTIPKSDRLEWTPENRRTPWSDGAGGRVMSTRTRLKKAQIQVDPTHNKAIEMVLHESAIRLSRCLVGRFDVDHILPLSRGGRHHHTNLRVIPKHLNSVKREKTDRECVEIAHILNIWSGRMATGIN